MEDSWVNELDTMATLLLDVSVKIDDFMASNKVLLTVRCEHADFHLSVRKSYRLIGDAGYSSLDMYHFTINTFYRRLGAATKIIKELHRKNTNRITYLTHIQDKPLENYLNMFGWQRDKDTSFYKFTH